VKKVISNLALKAKFEMLCLLQACHFFCLLCDIGNTIAPLLKIVFGKAEI
jgi:hypothetical protein